MRINPTTGEVTLEPEQVEFRTEFNYDREWASLESGISFPEDEGKTQQQFKDECDINTIVKRFGITGQLPEALRIPQFADYSETPDYQTALHLVIAARESFLEVPADIRERFSHDPGRFIAFCEDPHNADELVRLGLAVKRMTPEEVQAVKGDAPE